MIDRTAPLITIIVRHRPDCVHKGNEAYKGKGCNCRKSLRYFFNGKQHRVSAKTRSWTEAERAKRLLEDQFLGTQQTSGSQGRTIRAAVDVFIAKKRVEGLTSDLIGKYELWLGRLASYCEGEGAFTVSSITGEIVIGFMKNWGALYPSTLTRNKLRERYKSFTRFCQTQGWLAVVPDWPKIRADETETMPLEPEEYTRLLDAVYVVVRAPHDAVMENQTYEYWTKRVHGLFQLMRWSGLSIMDALTLQRSKLFQGEGDYRVVTIRTKTKMDVSVVMPPAVSAELLAVPNDNLKYFFWSGKGKKKSICGNWGKRFIVPAFNEAGIECEGHMRSHRLRDTFAVEMLKAGASLEDVSKALGHKSIRTTEQHYAKWVKGRQDRLDVQVKKAWNPVSPTKRKNVRAA